MLLLHGWGQSSKCFESVASYFSQFFRVTLVDFDGFGNSNKLSEPKTIVDYSNDILSLIKEKNLHNIILLGHSFGGRVAIELTYKYPEIFDKLILVDSAGILPKRTIKYYVKIYLYKLKKILKLNTNNCGSNDYKALDNIMKKTFVNVVNYNQKNMLESIKTNTLIIFGKEDKVTPIYMAKIFKNKLPNSKLVLFDNCGHFPFIDDYYKFVVEVSKFING